MENKKTTSTTELLTLMGKIAQGSDGNVVHLSDALEQTAKRVEDSVRDSKAMNDSYGNSLLSIGNNDKVTNFTNYQFSNDTLNYLLWLSLYNDSWVFKRAIDKPAQDEVKCGITLQGQANKDKVYRLLKQYRFDLIQLLQWGALFGGSVAVMMFDHLKDEDYATQISKNKIKNSKYMKLYVTDRWYGCSPTYDKTVSSMGSLDYGKPKFYTITFTNGKQLKVHHSYILRYEHRTAPKLIKMGQLQGWGYAEGSHILNELMRDDKMKSTIQSLMDKSLIEVIKMAGMRGVFLGADSENNEQLKQRLEMVNWGRNYNSLTFLDKDDDYQMTGFSGLSGLSDLLQQNMWQISAALEMQGILFGDLKQGFSNDTQAMERYSETIHERCESYVRPVYEKLLKVLYMICGINEKVEFDFNTLIKEQQDEKRIDGLERFTRLCSQLLNDGIISPRQYATAMQTYSLKGIVDFGFTDKELKKLDEDVVNEDFDLGSDMPTV